MYKHAYTKEQRRLTDFVFLMKLWYPFFELRGLKGGKSLTYSSYDTDKKTEPSERGDPSENFHDRSWISKFILF